MEGKPAFYRRRRRRDNELGQVLLRKGVIQAEDLRRALKIQEEQGGHVGAILRRLGASPRERGSMNGDTCPDIFELSDGNFAVIGTEVETGFQWVRR